MIVLHSSRTPPAGSQGFVWAMTRVLSWYTWVYEAILHLELQSLTLNFLCTDSEFACGLEKTCLPSWSGDDIGCNYIGKEGNFEHLVQFRVQMVWI